MSIIIPIESQPNFPRADLTESNAAIIELVLANTSIVEAGHLSAETVSRMFKAGHASIIIAAQRLDYDANQIEAIDFGVSALETISGLMLAIPEEDEVGDITVNAAALTSCFSERDLRRFADKAVDTFVDSTPITADVISVAGRRFFGGMTSYALLGAAMASQFEADCTTAA